MSEKKAVGLTTGGQLKPVIPTTFEDFQRIAAMAVTAGMFDVRGKDEKQRQAYATLALMQGAEIGMSPMMSLQNIAIINGNCRIWGKAVVALIRGNGHGIKKIYEGESFTDGWTAKVTITRGDTEEEIEGSFSWAQAKRAGLSSKDGPWKQYPERMMYWRALGFACTDGTPEVLCGMYIAEEVEDEQTRFEQAKDVTPELEIPSAPIFEEIDQSNPIEDVSQEVTETVEQPSINYAEFIEEISIALDICLTEEAIDGIWEEYMESISSTGHEHRHKFDDLYENHIRRVRDKN